MMVPGNEELKMTSQPKSVTGHEGGCGKSSKILWLCAEVFILLTVDDEQWRPFSRMCMVDVRHPHRFVLGRTFLEKGRKWQVLQGRNPRLLLPF